MPSEISVRDGWTASVDINTVAQLSAVIDHLQTYKGKASVDSWPPMFKLLEMHDNQYWSQNRYRPAFTPFKLNLLFFQQEDVLLFKLSFVKPSDG